MAYQFNNEKVITSISWSFDKDTVKSVSAGVGNVIEIHEHQCGGEGDKWFYDVEFENGQFLRIFNPNIVEFYFTEKIPPPY